MMSTDPYESSVPFVSDRIQAAAVYCSDGKFGEQVDDLLHESLALPRYDRLAIPGGPACLAGQGSMHGEEEATVNSLRFLVEAHQLQRVVLITHEDCAFYGQISLLQMERRQREDMAKAVNRVRGLAHGLVVDVFFAYTRGNRVLFEKLDL